MDCANSHAKLLIAGIGTGGARRGMAMTTSGMPFAVSRASAQKPVDQTGVGGVVSGISPPNRFNTFVQGNGYTRVLSF